MTVRKRDIRLKDISALTAETGDEFALFTKGSERFVKRESPVNALLSESELRELAEGGWRFSVHTHPGSGNIIRNASAGDRKVMALFNQSRIVILDSVGGFSLIE